MIDLIKDYMLNWHTKKEIIVYYNKTFNAKLNERLFRLSCEKNNKNYYEGKTSLYVAHSNKGYILTSDKELIKKSISDDKKRGLKLLKRYYQTNKSLSEQDQLSILPQEAKLYEIVVNMEV